MVSALRAAALAASALVSAQALLSALHGGAFMEGFWPGGAAEASRLLDAGLGGKAAAFLSCAVWLIPLGLELRLPRPPRREEAQPAVPAAALLAAWLGFGAWAWAGPTAALSSLALHAALAAAAGALLCLGGGTAATLACAWLVLSGALAGLGLPGPFAWTWAALAAAALTASGPALFAALPRAPLKLLTPAALVLGLAASRLGPALDWKHTLQTLLTAASWAALAGLAARAGLTRARRPWLVPAGALALSLLAAGAAALSARRVSLAGAARLAEADPSYRLARRLVEPRGSGWLEDLGARLNRRRLEAPAPLDLPLSEALAGGPTPPVFVIVVDSLRADALERMPRLRALARASWTPRAFTAYAGTALSEPTFWTGAHQPPGPFPRPFAPMNALEKLLAARGYRRLLAYEVILRAVVSPQPGDEALDPLATGANLLCPSLEALERKLGGKGPVFAYVQAHDLHFALLRRQNATYEQALARVDACLGRFADGLKRRGLWDKALLVVSSDHGDSRGEEGRWGHDTLTPEVVRVPLLLRAPFEKARKPLDRAVLLTDLVPTLYDLLGARPQRKGFPLGASIFEPAEAERLIVSSYGPSAGLLLEDGRKLFAADAADRTELLYDLESGRAEPVRDPALEKRLLDRLDALDRVYGR